MVRPLLGVGAAALRAFCAEHGLPAVQDPSNEDLTQMRNIIRALLAGRRVGSGLQGLDSARGPAAVTAQGALPGQEAGHMGSAQGAQGLESDSEPAQLGPQHAQPEHCHGEPTASSSSGRGVDAWARCLYESAGNMAASPGPHAGLAGPGPGPQGHPSHPARGPYAPAAQVHRAEPAAPSGPAGSQPAAPVQHAWDPVHGMRIVPQDAAGAANPSTRSHAQPAVQRVEEPVHGASASLSDRKPSHLGSAGAAGLGSLDPEHGAWAHYMEDSVPGGASPCTDPAQQAGGCPPGHGGDGPVRSARMSGLARRTHPEAGGARASDGCADPGPGLSSQGPGSSAATAHAPCASQAGHASEARSIPGPEAAHLAARAASAAREADLIRLARACDAARQRMWARAGELITAAVQPRLGGLWGLPRPGAPAGPHAGPDTVGLGPGSTPTRTALGVRPAAGTLSGGSLGCGAVAGGRGGGEAGSGVAGDVGASGAGARDHVAEGQREVALRSGIALGPALGGHLE